MAAQIIDGKAAAKEIRSAVAQKVKSLLEQGGPRPGLAVILVGDDPASNLYVNMKKKACSETGIYSEEHRLAAETPQEEVLQLIDQLNHKEDIHGILVQLPLPASMDQLKVVSSVDPSKDVDGFHPVNVGKLCIGEKTFVPCTPGGIMYLLDSINADLTGKKAVVLGRSNIVGKPMAQLLVQRNATVTLCHSKTKDLAGECRAADVLIAAVGVPEMVKADWIKPGAIVIDVGINRVGGKTVGDVAFAAVKEVAGRLTPVPGGVGPMTIAMLLSNTVAACEAR